MSNIVMSGTGVYTPPHAVSNDEIVDSYNEFAEKYNTEHADAIEAGDIEAKALSSSAFIEKASGVKNRYMMNKSGTIDVNRMHPTLSELAPEHEIGFPVQAQMGLNAAKEALDRAGLEPEDIDLLIMSCSIAERHVPSLACHVQEKLGTKGFSFDMAMGCSSATFGISTAMDSLLSGMATKALVITAEYLTPAMNYEDRDSHFIFGDAAVAMVLEREEDSKSPNQFRIKTRELFTEFSPNIRAAFGTRILLERDKINNKEIRFQQDGRKVFKELLPKVIKMVEGHLKKNNLTVDELSRMWLHQANINMNQFATRKLIGREPTQDIAPLILDEYANTAGAGCMIAFHKYHEDLSKGDLGLICSFGASYSIGCIIIERI